MWFDDALPLVIVITLTLFLLVALFIILLVVIQNRRIKNKLAVKRLKEDYLQALTKAEVEIVQRTMSEIGSELHDNVGQILVAAQIGMMNKFEDSFEDDFMLREIVETLEHGVDEVNRIGRALNQTFWKSRSLFEGIVKESMRLERLSKIIVHIEQAEEQDNLYAGERIILFRVFQEVIQNILKHSNAELINITIKADPFLIKITDDGKGFDIDNIQDSNGISNIKERCELINISSSLKSNLGKGTTWIFRRN